MSRAGRIGAVLAALASTAALTAAAHAAVTPGTLTTDGAWSWFADPRAVYHAGAHRRTYVGWVTGAGDIVVGSYDLDSHQAIGRILAPAFDVDDHASPALYLRRDGRIAVFWSGHSEPRMLQRVTARPEDVTAWGPVRAVGTNTAGPQGYTYPNPIRLDGEGGRLWLFWRGGAGQPAFSTSGDEGLTWAPARTLIDVPGQRPYVKYASDGAGTIHLAFTEGNPDSTHTSVFYAAYRAGRLHRADGSEIAALADVPIEPWQADRVHDAGGGPPAWVHDVAADAAGRPVIVYATFPSDADHRYRYARWTGDHWADSEITGAGPAFPEAEGNNKYSGGIVLDHEDPSVVWLSRAVGAHHAVERWHTPDGGATWSSERVSPASAADDVRPVTPRGLPAGRTTDVLWMHGAYSGFTDYRMSLMGLLDGGARPAVVEPLVQPEPAAAPAPAPGPAAAARHASLLTLTARRRHGRARLRGRLVDAATRAGLRGRRVTLLAKRRRAFKRVATLTSGRAGHVRQTRRLRATTAYRLRFAGDGGSAPSRSRAVRVR